MPDFIAEFSPKAKEIIHFAQEEALILQNHHLGTEHLLLGLLHVNEEDAAYVLHSMNISLLHARTMIEQVLGREKDLLFGEKHLVVTQEFRHALHLAADEAQNLQQNVGAEHLLLALTLMPDSKADLILQRLGINLDELRTKTFQAFPPSESASIEPSNPKQGFNKFTQRAQHTIVRATQEAWIFQQNYDAVRLEHFFLGLLCAGNGVAMQVLTQLVLDIEALEQAFVQHLYQQDYPGPQSYSLTQHSKKAIELAVKEARRFEHHYIGTEHLLLGMIGVNEKQTKSVFTRLGLSMKRTGEDSVGDIFASFGLDLKCVRSKTLSVLLAGAVDNPG